MESLCWRPAGQRCACAGAREILVEPLAVPDQTETGLVGLVGWAAGGWVALALAARRPDLIDRTVLCGTPAPHEHVPWRSNEQEEALAALRGLAPEAALATFSQQLARLLPADPQAATALSVFAASPADEETLRAPGARERLARMLEAAFAQGVVGWASDLAGSLRPWGVDPGAVRAKTLLLYGSRDPVAGPRHGTWLCRAAADQFEGHDVRLDRGFVPFGEAQDEVGGAAT